MPPVHTVEANSMVPRPHAPPPRAGFPPRHLYGVEEDQEDDDFFPTYHKLDFPKYDSACDPLPWLNQALLSCLPHPR
jgi:hypothetical protein